MWRAGHIVLGQTLTLGYQQPLGTQHKPQTTTLSTPSSLLGRGGPLHIRTDRSSLAPLPPNKSICSARPSVSPPWCSPLNPTKTHESFAVPGRHLSQGSEPQVWRRIPQGGEHGEVLVDLQHGGVQQRVDVAQALQPRLQVLSLVALQSPQLVRGQPRKASRGHRHWWEGCGEVASSAGGTEGLSPNPPGTQGCSPAHRKGVAGACPSRVGGRGTRQWPQRWHWPQGPGEKQLHSEAERAFLWVREAQVMGGASKAVPPPHIHPWTHLHWWTEGLRPLPSWGEVGQEGKEPWGATVGTSPEGREAEGRGELWREDGVVRRGTHRERPK